MDVPIPTAVATNASAIPGPMSSRDHPPEDNAAKECTIPQTVPNNPMNGDKFRY